MIKIPSVLQFCYHHGNKSTKPIIRLFSQLKFIPPKDSNPKIALLPPNTHTTNKTSNFSSTTYRTSTSEYNPQTQNNPDENKDLSKANTDKNDELSNVNADKIEELSKVNADKNEELTKVNKDKNEELSMDNPDKNEELGQQPDKNEVSKVVKYLKSKGYSSKDIKDNCLPYINTTHSSYLKVMLLSELHSDIQPLMPLMSCTLSSLRMAAKLARFDRDSSFPDRITYLSHNLETQPQDLIPPLSKHPTLLTMQFDRLERKMDTLRAAGISPRHILKDLWIFNYKEELLAERIAAAKKAGVELKPWMLRCSMKTFRLIIEKSSEAQSVLKGEDEMDYLARRLDCGRDYVEYMMDRNKLLRAIAIPKMDKVLNFLYEKGYTPAEVRLFPRVFCSSVQTLNRRFNEFSGLKATLPTVSQLCVKSRKRKTHIEQESSTKGQQTQ